MNRTYKGFEIVKQTVGVQGWNVVRDGRCVKTGLASIAAAKEFITYTLDCEAMPREF